MGEDELDVDIGKLCHAYEDYDIEHSYFLDLETGEIVFISHYTGRNEEIMKEVEKGLGERYISLPRTTSREGYRDMEDFIETVEDETLKDKLYLVIDGKGAFRRFKNVLKEQPDERKRWFDFKRTRTVKRVKDWLNAEGIEVKNMASEA